MKTTKTIIGIISMVLFVFITIQSCATGLSNALDDNLTDTSGAAGFFLALLMLIAGIVGVSTKNSKGGGITAGVFYLVAALIGFINLGTFGDLVIWSVLSLCFGLVFIIGSVVKKKPTQISSEK